MMGRIRLFCESVAGCAVAMVAAFAGLTVLHDRLDALRGFDLWIQGEVHGWAGPGLTEIMRLLSVIGSTKCFVPGLTLFVGWMLYTRQQRTAITLVLGMVGAIALNDVFKAYFHRMRPQPVWALAHETTYSYPSGHALYALVLYGLIAYLAMTARKGWASLVVLGGCLVLAASIGLSRIYLGVHWPTDICAGYMVGALWLGAVIFNDLRWRRSC